MILGLRVKWFRTIKLINIRTKDMRKISGKDTTMETISITSKMREIIDRIIYLRFFISLITMLFRSWIN